MTRRTGMTLLEIVAAASILAAVATITAQAIALSFRHTVQQRDYSLALREATNAMTVAQQLPANQVSTTGLLQACTELGMIDRLKLNGMTLDIAVAEPHLAPQNEPSVPSEIFATKIMATVVWQRRQQPQQVQLVAWRHEHSPASPKP